MNFTGIDKANIENLTSLWRRMGVRPRSPGTGERLNVSTSWPHRHWFDQGAEDLTAIAIDDFIGRLGQDSVVPVWGDLGRGQLQIEPAMIAAGYAVSFEQTAMYLDLETQAETSRGMELQRVTSRAEIEVWTDIASEAFAYEIDASVIERLGTEPAVQLLLGYCDGQPAATAMLYKTSEVIGVHQVGVAQAFQGRGIGHALMLRVIELGRLWRGRYITLQASAAGEGLYRRLGFHVQFTIRNYRSVGPPAH